MRSPAPFKRLRLMLLLWFTTQWCYAAAASTAIDLRIAVASNFKPALESLLPAFSAQHPDINVRLSAGASGQLFAQIQQGAPFDLFLSADTTYPSKLSALGSASVPQSYAYGMLLLVSQSPADSWRAALENSRHLAIANPALAPYGVAAQDLLRQATLWPVPDTLTLAMGSNIAQVQHWFDTGHVDTAFTAAALHLQRKQGFTFDLTSLLRTPIEQQMVILTRTQHCIQAQTFVNFLLDESTQSQLPALGYLPATGQKSTP